MSRLLTLMRNIVWPAVLSALFITLAVLLAVVNPAAITLPIVLAVSAVALALLAQQA